MSESQGDILHYLTNDHPNKFRFTIERKKNSKSTRKPGTRECLVILTYTEFIINELIDKCFHLICQLFPS